MTTLERDRFAPEPFRRNLRLHCSDKAAAKDTPKIAGAHNNRTARKGGNHDQTFQLAPIVADRPRLVGETGNDKTIVNRFLNMSRLG